MTLPAAFAPFVRPQHQRQSAFVTDFDGTLAPIIDDPARATPLPVSISALRTLAAKFGVVAVVSGRPVEFLRRHVPIDDVVLVGQYGLERWVDGRVEPDPRAAAYIDAVATAATYAEEHWPSLLIERKGTVAFTVHWRTTPGDEPDPAELAALAAEHELVTQPGRMACELRPPVPVDKGTVFLELVEERGCTYKAFAGDDVGDLAAFRVVFGDGQQAEEHTVRVAVRSHEAPPDLLELADVIVDGPAGLAALLGELAAAVSPDAPR